MNMQKGASVRFPQSVPDRWKNKANRKLKFYVYVNFKSVYNTIEIQQIHIHEFCARDGQKFRFKRDAGYVCPHVMA